MKRRMVVLVVLLMMLFVHPVTTRASDDPPEQGEFDFKDSLGVRVGTDSCWVRHELGAGRSFCIPHVLWRRWLFQNPITQGVWVGKWKARAGPENEIGTSHLKHPELVFQATQVTQVTALQPGRTSSCKMWIWLRIEQVRERFSQLLTPGDQLGILRRLLLDERVPGSPLGFLRLLGFIHLFTASGIHLYSLARVTHRTTAAVGRVTGIPARIAVHLSSLISIAMWSVAWLLCGMRAGMLRPWLLVMARMAAKKVGFRWRGLSPLVLALSFDLGAGLFRAFFTHDSIASWAPGRIHYALAVGGGFLALEQFKQWRPTGENSSILAEHMILSLGSWIFVALWGVWECGWVALGTPLLSLLTLPLFSSVIYPGTFLGLVLGSTRICSFFASVSSWGIFKLAEFSLRLPSLWMISHRSLALSAMLAAGILVFRPTFDRFPVRWLTTGVGFVGIFWLLLKVAAASFYIPPGSFQAQSVEQLDIGQGDAALVQISGSRTFGPFGPSGVFGMIDVGSEKALSSEAWLKLFGERGVRRLSFIGISHLDEDHVGALLKLAPLIEIGCVATASEELHSEKAGKYIAALWKVGVRLESWQSGCFPFSVHGPDFEIRTNPSAHPKGHPKDGNENMSAFFIPLQDGSAYFSMGDAERNQELKFLRWEQTVRKPGQPVILKVSHHGSRFSTSPELLQELKPEEAWISAGVGNRHGHPTHATLELLAAEKILVRRTDLEGALRLKEHLKEKPSAIDHQNIARHP